MLYPRPSASRRVTDLSGIWAFRLDPDEQGFKDTWFKTGIPKPDPMPVPASYNDLLRDAGDREHIGWAWYEKELWLGSELRACHSEIRFDAVAHRAKVWINGLLVAEHTGGFLPFSVNLTPLLETLHHDQPNRLVVAVDNRLSWDQLPPGEVVELGPPTHPEGYKRQDYHFDFFHFAGIQRPVRLVSMPVSHLRGLRVETDLLGDGSASVKWYARPSEANASITVDLIDGDQIIASGSGATGQLTVKHPRVWRPGDGQLYTLQVKCDSDIYRQPIGLRSVRVEGDRFLINGEPFYFRGFGKHEDALFAGRGLDLPTMVKDMHLLNWVGANSFRTSHYPYAEEVLDLADREGIVVISESPAVGLWDHSGDCFIEQRVNQATLKTHREVMTELIERDANHPCVVMWSVANEPATWEAAARPYFQDVIEHTRCCDTTRPVTVVTCPHSTADNCLVSDLIDVVCVNRYQGWYFDPGRLEVVEMQLTADLKAMHAKFGKPIIITEYGADTIAGLHQEPPMMFSEEFQVAFLNAYHKVYDQLPFVIGEHVWNFADFATKQGISRVDGNKKGVFTRDRRPKMAAHALRSRWIESE